MRSVTLLQLLFGFLANRALRLWRLCGASDYSDQVVAMHGWLSMPWICGYPDHISDDTGTDCAINAASFVGTKIAGLGALVASLGVVLPSFIIVLTLSFLYYKYRQLDAIQAVLKGSTGGGCFDCICGVSLESMPSGEEKRYRLQMLIWCAVCTVFFFSWENIKTDYRHAAVRCTGSWLWFAERKSWHFRLLHAWCNNQQYDSIVEKDAIWVADYRSTSIPSW